MSHRSPLAALLAAVAVLLPWSGPTRAADAGQVQLKQNKGAIEVSIGGTPFTTYVFDAPEDPKFARPYFYPVLAADGTPLTSDQVHVPKGDHPHHRSFYVAHGDVNGIDHWLLAKDGNHARQRHLSFDKVEGDTVVQRLAWEAPGGKPVQLNETRTLRFFAAEDGARGVDLTVALTPAGDGPVTLGDTKEAGLCSVRVAKAISDAATITTAAGLTGEKAAWGKPAAWCDMSGVINGKPYGVAILDHPANPRHPTRWHVRAYGLMSANVFGLHDFDKTPRGAGALALAPGTTTTFRYRVLFHAGDAKAAKLDEKLAAFAKE